MGYQSQTGHLGLKTQTAKGAFLDPGAVAPNQGVFVRFTSGSMGGNRELLVPDPEIGAGRDIPDAALGPISYSGEFDAYGRMEVLTTLLRGALGAGGSSVTTGVGTHTITPATTIPWLSVEESVGGATAGAAFETFRYTDAKVNTLHLEADAGGYLMTTFGLIALTQLADTTPTAVGVQRIDTSPLLLGTNILVKYNGANLPAKSFSLDINNNLEDDDYLLGSLTLGDLVEKRREITMGVTVRPDDSSMWKAAMYGSAGASAPVGGAALKDDVQIVITAYEDIPGGTPATKYKCTIDVPFGIIAPFNVEPSGDDVIENDLEIRAVKSTATDIMTATILSAYATIP